MRHLLAMTAIAAMTMAVPLGSVRSQGTNATEAHLATARTAAQQDYTDLFDTTCGLVRPSMVVDTAPAPPAVPTGPQAWTWLDITAGVPRIDAATSEQFVPQMVNLELLSGVDFKKGCYPGQEIVARMHYLGRLKQRMYLANIEGAESPQPGDKLYSADMGDQASGMIVSAAPSPDGGSDVLAAIQIESVKGDAVHWKSLNGPRLRFSELPYKF